MAWWLTPLPGPEYHKSKRCGDEERFTCHCLEQVAIEFSGRPDRASPREIRGAAEMTRRFKVGDHVTWNSEAGWVTGRIIRVHTRDIEYKGYRRRATREEPQYEIKSDKTEHVAMHKGSALQLMRSKG
jgi:Hypervirulence associated proteins TUDOR domain